MKEYLISVLPYLAALAVLGLYVLLVGGAHVLALYLIGPAFPARFPRLSAWMKATGIDWSAALYTLADNVPKPTILGSKVTAMDPCMNVIPKPESSKPKIPPIAGLTLSLSVLLLGPAICFVPLASCQSFPPANSTITTEAVDAGCKLVGILDTHGVPVVAICESLAPVIGSWIADAINAAESASKPKGQSAPPSYVILTRGEKVIGWARADVAPAVQAKIDSAP